MSSQQDLEFTLKDFTQIFEHAGSRLLAIRIELEKTKLTISPDDRRVIGEYLNWDIEVSFNLSYFAQRSIDLPGLHTPLDGILRRVVYQPTTIQAPPSHGRRAFNETA
jgi:hypothetical protein